MNVTSFFTSLISFISNIILKLFSLDFTIYGYSVSFGWLVVTFAFFGFAITVFWMGVRK